MVQYLAESLSSINGLIVTYQSPYGGQEWQEFCHGP